MSPRRLVAVCGVGCLVTVVAVAAWASWSGHKPPMPPARWVDRGTDGRLRSPYAPHPLVRDGAYVQYRRLARRNIFRPPGGRTAASFADVPGDAKLAMLPPMGVSGALPSAADKLADWAYVGSATVDGQHMAIMQNKTTHAGACVRAGQAFAGALVVGVKAESVRLLRADGEVELPLAPGNELKATPKDQPKATTPQASVQASAAQQTPPPSGQPAPAQSPSNLPPAPKQGVALPMDGAAPSVTPK